MNTASEQSPYAIELVSVGKQYKNGTTALSDFSLDIEDGEFLVLLGPSGCGKSTILKIIAGLEDATDGEIYIAGRLANYIPPKARDVAMVFQNYALYPHMTVEQNLGFPLKMRGEHKDRVRARVDEVAGSLEIRDQLGKHPEHLSGGQRQRVALGRALIRNPVAFLMDEPLSNLDALLRVQMRLELLKLHRKFRRTTIYVTHDQVEAMTMADRIVVMRSGVIQQVGTTSDVYARPANTFVATFIGSPQMNLLRGRIAKTGDRRRFVGSVDVALDGAAIPTADGEEVILGIRPEDVDVVTVTAPGVIPGHVTLIEAIGSDSHLEVEVSDGVSMMVRVSARSQAREGDHVGLRFPVEHLHLFDADGSRIAGTRQTAAVG